MGETVLDVRDAKIYFPVREGLLRKRSPTSRRSMGSRLCRGGGYPWARGRIRFGKTTLVNGITMLEPLTRSITFEGRELSLSRKRERKEMRRSIQIVFQDPFWSLNPRWLVRDIVGEPLKAHQKLRGDATRTQSRSAGDGGPGVGSDLYKYPHEFSGGMRQRIAIARALILQPQLVALDEPTSAIDVLSQHQILLMLQDLKERLGLTFILVSHDLAWWGISPPGSR